MVDCCATDPTACTDLKAQFPQLSSGDPDVNPDYCYMHGNVCSRCALQTPKRITHPFAAQSCTFGSPSLHHLMHCTAMQGSFAAQSCIPCGATPCLQQSKIALCA